MSGFNEERAEYVSRTVEKKVKWWSYYCGAVVGLRVQGGRRVRFFLEGVPEDREVTLTLCNLENGRRTIAGELVHEAIAINSKNAKNVVDSIDEQLKGRSRSPVATYVYRGRDQYGLEMPETLPADWRWMLERFKTFDRERHAGAMNEIATKIEIGIEKGYLDDEYVKAVIARFAVRCVSSKMQMRQSYQPSDVLIAETVEEEEEETFQGEEVPF